MISGTEPTGVKEMWLNLGVSFDERMEWLKNALVDKDDPGSVEDWNARILKFDESLFTFAKLREVELKYSERRDVPDELSYTYFLKVSYAYAIAAQRAHNNADFSGAWNMITEAAHWLHRHDFEHDLDQSVKVIQKRIVAAENASVPRQRVQFQIIMLLDRVRQKRPVVFQSIHAAIKEIDRDIALFLGKEKLQSSYQHLERNVRDWIRDHPAFRAEMAPFFTPGLIEGLKPRKKRGESAELRGRPRLLAENFGGPPLPKARSRPSIFSLM